MTTFSEIVEAANKLSLDEQETLVEILQRRIASMGRAALSHDVAEARAEFSAGRMQPQSAAEILHEVRGAP